MQITKGGIWQWEQTAACVTMANVQQTPSGVGNAEQTRAHGEQMQ